MSAVMAKILQGMSMSVLKKLCAFLILGCVVFLAELGHAKKYTELEVISVGVRGAMNSDMFGLPPTEKEDFQQYEVFAVIGFPGSWEWPTGWETRYRWYGSAGVIRGGGDTGFVGTLGPGLAVTNWDWRVTLDLATGTAFFPDYTFGRQDFGGPFQIVGSGGVSYHFQGNIIGGYRFHHISDATLYGNNNRGVDLHMLEISYGF